MKFLQNGTLVGLLPVPHPILIRKYQPNLGTIMWLKTYMWGVIYLRFRNFHFYLFRIDILSEFTENIYFYRNLDPPIWYDTNVKLFEIQRT